MSAAPSSLDLGWSVVCSMKVARSVIWKSTSGVSLYAAELPPCRDDRCASGRLFDLEVEELPGDTSDPSRSCLAADFVSECRPMLTLIFDC